MKDSEAMKLKPGTFVLLRDGRTIIIDDLRMRIYEENKLLPQSLRRQWIAAGYADKEHPYGVRVWLWPAQIVKIV